MGHETITTVGKVEEEMTWDANKHTLGTGIKMIDETTTTTA